MKCTFGLNILQAFILPVDIQTRHDQFFARRKGRVDGSLAKSLAHYTLIAFDKRVTFWLQRAGSLPCVCVFAALYACAIA